MKNIEKKIEELQNSNEFMKVKKVLDGIAASDINSEKISPFAGDQIDLFGKKSREVNNKITRLLYGN